MCWHCGELWTKMPDLGSGRNLWKFIRIGSPAGILVVYKWWSSAEGITVWNCLLTIQVEMPRRHFFVSFCYHVSYTISDSKLFSSNHYPSNIWKANHSLAFKSLMDLKRMTQSQLLIRKYCRAQVSIHSNNA